MTKLALGLVLTAAVVVAIVALLRMDPLGRRNARTGSDYLREVREEGAIDSGQVGWEESPEPLAIEMESPRALCVDAEDRIHVIGDRLQILAADGEQLVLSERLDEVYVAVVAIGQDQVFALATERVDLLELRGSQAVWRGSLVIEEEGVELVALAITAEGLFVADAAGRRVFRVLTEVGDDHRTQYELFAEDFMVPSSWDLAVAPEGELVTVDPGRHSVQIRDAYGDVVRSFGAFGDELEDFHGCCNPAAVAMFPDGRTLTAEKGLGATRVKVYDALGRLESVVAPPQVFDEALDGPPIVLDVAIDSRGRALVLDPARKQVRIFTPLQER